MADSREEVKTGDGEPLGAAGGEGMWSNLNFNL